MLHMYICYSVPHVGKYSGAVCVCVCACVRGEGRVLTNTSGSPRSVFGPARSLPNFCSLIVSRSGGSNMSMGSIILSDKGAVSVTGHTQLQTRAVAICTRVNQP